LKNSKDHMARVQINMEDRVVLLIDGSQLDQIIERRARKIVRKQVLEILNEQREIVDDLNDYIG